MKTLVCAVRDSAANVYGRPFVCQTTAIAIRSFADEVQRQSPDNLMSQHPSDFALYKIGEYDDEVGVITPCATPTLLIPADQCVKPNGV